MLIRTAQRGVILGCSHINNILAAFVQFAADGLEDGPVPLVIGKDDKGDLLVGCFYLSATDFIAKLDHEHP